MKMEEQNFLFQTTEAFPLDFLGKMREKKRGRERKEGNLGTRKFANMPLFYRKPTWYIISDL